MDGAPFPFAPPGVSPPAKEPSGTARWIKSIAIAFVLLTVILFAGCGALFALANREKNDALGYVHESLPRILTTWNEDELIGRLTPQTAAETRNEPGGRKLHAFFATGREKLGAYRSVDAPRQWNSVAMSGGVTVRAVLPAHFEHGDADVNLVLVKHQGRWSYGAFHVSLP